MSATTRHFLPALPACSTEETAPPRQVSQVPFLYLSEVNLSGKYYIGITNIEVFFSYLQSTVTAVSLDITLH